MVKKAVALFVAYSFFANSLWSLTAQGVRVGQSTGPMNWHVATSVDADKHALTTSALSSTTPPAAISSALPSATSIPRGPLDGDGQSTSCTIHSTQPSSDDDSNDTDQGYGAYTHHNYKYGSDDHSSGVAPSVVASGVTIFGPQTFVRTTGAPNEFDSTITVPAWIAQPFYLHVVNGDSSGNHRISSATVSINGVTLLSQSDFNQQMASADCAVNLTVPTSQLHVELASKPGSFLTLNILGQNQDHTPPVLTITAPASGSTVNTTTPHIALSYNDVKGATEPAASGVNVPSLKVLLDSVDRTSLFTERPNDASADVPASLALSQGPHTITATIQDNAGNTATATSQFQVVTQSTLAIQITQPQAGSFLNSLSVPVQITYSDSVSINTSTLKVLVNGVDRTSLFTVTATGATGTVTGQQGANQIVASISDVSSAQASASSAFNIDTVPPTITILHPVPGSTHGSSAVEYTVQYSDDQALDLTSLKILVDGTPQVVTPGASTASGTVTLADGNHTLTASIKDKTGNQATASSTFSVDTTAPSIHITQPAPGAIQNFANAQIQVQYGDNENINTASFKITIDGVDQTSFFTVTATGASASLPGPFGEGSHTIAAQIADQTGNVGQTSSTFVVDTIKPVLTLVSPVGPINTTSPSALAQYSDSGTGINTGSVHVFVDGSDVTSAFSVASTSVTGTLAGLSEGTHQFRVTVADRAGNVADQSVSFLVDVTPPAISFTAPANNVFINNTQPAVTLNYSDSGAGINQASLHIFLQAGSSAETEITSAFTIGVSQANGTIGTPTPLTPGTYKLRAQVLDNAGNSSTAISAFQVDTQPPTYVIQLPAANSFLNTATPSLLVTYQDDSSGVDPAQFAIRVDGVDRTNRLTVTATSASGALLAGDALADGTHQVEVTVVDRAGNQAPIVPQSFLVDTTPPTISISAPGSGSFTNNNLFPISVTYADSGSGIDITKFHLTIDGIDQTAQFTATATGATGIPTAVLLDGVHTIVATIQDLAGNASSASVAFSVDTAPPQITITQPVNGVFTNAASLIVTGSVVDASPVTVTIEGAAVPVKNNSFTSAGITLGTSATQLIHVVATDAAGNSSTVTLTINIDRTPPTITGAISPPPNAAGWNNAAVTVTFTCADADSGIATCPAPVQLATEGANQAVTGTAVDKAGNVAQATVTVNIDKTPPVITGTPAPAPNAAGWNTTDVTITYTCSDSLSGVLQCPPVRTVSTDGKAQQITATVSDVAGNTATSTVVLNIEKTAPSITASVAPPPNAASWNNTNVTVSFLCAPSASDIVSCQTPIAVTTEGKGQLISGTVTDQAGKSNTTTATVNIDKTAPSISASTNPSPNAAGWNNTDVLISYLCSDSLSGIAICPTPVTVSTEGSSESISAQATDQAGNSASVTTTLNIDKTPPLVTATAAPSPNGAGWNNTNVTVTFSCTDSLSGVATCPPQQLVASEGQNQNISGQATDIAGNVGTGSISLSIDKTPPTIVQLSTPDHVSRLHSGQVTVTVNDNFFVSQVVITVNGTSLGTFTSAPYQATLQAPAGSNPGDTLTVTALATDEAGNTQSSSRAVRVAADGVIVGQVLSDATSFPIQGAVVQTISSTSANDQTDDHGRYTLLASDSHLFLSAASAAPPTTTVEREVFVQDGVGTVPVDARLTPLTSPVSVGSTGGTVSAGNISITVPAGAVGDGTTMQLTPLTGQGLPGLLPLGWSPLAAFDFRASSSAMNLTATVTQLPNSVMHLATYNPALHAWTMVAANLQSVSGGINIVVPAPGAYALVLPDLVIPPITVPDPGNPLPGIQMQLLDPAASSNGTLSPAILPPSGGTSTATLGVLTASPVPSGTVIQANVSETFSLTSGDLVSEETRSEDIVIYNALAPTNSTLGAQFAVAPSHKYTNSQLLTGKVHLDILAGREGVRGQPGGSDPVTLTDGIATLSVPGGALTQDTAVNVQGISLENFIPSNGSIGALQEVLVDFSGETLNTPGQLSISSTGLNPAHTFLLTQVQRIDGIPHIVLVALAQINGANLTSVATPGLPGITQGGEYVFYDVSAPLGFVQGVVSSSAGPVQALVQTDSLPIVSITGADGKYIVPAIAGTVNLKASSPHTNLTGSASVQVTAGQTVPTNISLTGTVTNAVVSPADGTLGVPVSTTITVTTTAPLNPQSISQSSLVLLKGTATSGTPVQLGPFVLSSSGTVLSFAPVANLDPATQYTIQVAGLADNFGGAVVVPVSSFTTKAVAPPNFDPNAITFSFPDTNGNVQVSAPPGSLPSGTKVLIVDATNASVLSLTVFNDGSLSGSMQATINDLLQITVTDPLGATTSFQRSQFVAPDGTTAIGPGGGTVTGPGGVELRVPAGALEQGATFKISGFGPDAFADRPNFAPEAIFASGLHISASGVTPFKQEVKLVFPKPAAASPNAAYFVFRRLQGTDGTSQVYEVIDEASLEGTGDSAKVVTNSPPYRGFVNLTNAFNNLSNSVPTAVGGVQANIDFLLDYADALVNSFRMQSGVVTGVVMQAQVGTNGGDTIFIPVANATVQAADDPLLVDPNTKKTVTTTDDQGHFVLWDPNYDGGNRRLVATPPGGGQPITVTAHEVTPGDDLSILDTVLFAAMAKLFQRFRNVAYVNATFPALPPPPSAPALQIQLYQPSASGPQLLTGIAPISTDLTVTVRSTTADIPRVSVQDLGAPLATPQNVAMAPAGSDGPIISLFNGTYNASHQGLFRITATVIPPLGGSPVTATLDFRAIQGAFNGNNVDLPNIPPTILSTIPNDGNQQVDLHVNPQIFFSEPVTNVSPATVTLTDTDLSQIIPVDISGVTPDGLVVDPVTSATIVTSILLQPLQLLEYNHHYSITFSTAIVDTDKDQNGNPAPKNLVSRPPIVFQTQSPEIETRPGSNLFSSPGVFVANNFAFYEQVGPNLDSGTMRIFDISNPVQPREITTILPFLGRVILGRPAVVTGETNNSYVTNGGPTPKSLIAIGAASYATPRPSNIHLFTDEKAASGKGKWIGSVSVSTEPIDGMLNSVVVKGSRVYGAVWRKGIVVVDVPTVVADVQATTGFDSILSDLDALLGSNLSSVNFNLYTEGRGYATDAVVNTIPVSQNVPCPPGSNSVNPNGTCNEEFNAYIYNIKASDYNIAGESATWVIGTGMVLPPSNAPSGTASTTVVAVNPTTNEVFRSTPSGNNITLLRGTALALGTVQNPNLPNLSNVAVVVGQGSAGSSVMFILDMTDPRFPVTLSVTTLDLSLPSDVLLRDKVVAVAFQHVTEFYDISDPTHPQPLGKVGSDSDPVGGHLAFSSDGTLLLSTNFVPGNPSDKSGGVHITDFGSGAYVNFIPPVLSKEDHPEDPNSTRTNEVNFDITTVMVPVATQVQSAQLQLFDSAGSAVPCNGQPVCNVALTGTAGKVSFAPEALTGQQAKLNAQVTYFLSNGDKLVSAKQPFHLGVVKILVDLNNDTIVDDNDRQLQLANARLAAADKSSGSDPTQDQNIKRFGFWQSDTSQLSVTLITDPDTGTSTLSASVNEDALQDYATLKIHAEALPPSNYTLGIKLGGSTWALTQKAAGPKSCADPGCTQINIPALLISKEHLSDSKTVQKQLGLLTSANTLCQNSTNTAGPPGECLSDSSGFLSLNNLPMGDTVALFRCLQCNTVHANANANFPTPPDGNREMLVQLVPSSGTPAELDRVDVDLRPLQSWVGAFSARDGSSGEDVPTPTLKPVSGWQNILPTGAQVTVLVHGFSVSRADALGRFIPKYVRRLYWTEHPVLAGQTVNIAPAGSPALNALGGAYVVGVTWNGNHIATLSGLGGVQITSGMFFPDDEITALQTGVPLADFFSQLTDGTHNNFVNVISHSLGNMAVNSALSRLPAGVVSNYMMNEAAMPAESFSATFPYNESDTAWNRSDPWVESAFSGIRGVLLRGHLKQLGLNNTSPGSTPNATPTPNCEDPTVTCATDQVWVNQLDDVLNSRCDLTFACLELFNDFYTNRFPGLQDPNHDYTFRWRNQRPGGMALDPSLDSSDLMGPWQGFFAGNLDKTTIFNSFNRGDCALNDAWFVNQILQEPDRSVFDQFLILLGPPGLIPELSRALLNVNSDPFPVSERWDNVGTQSWLTDVPDYPLQDATHSDLLWPDNSHRGIHIQWSRLAKWYPSRSSPAGLSDYSIFVHNNGDNVDLTSYGAGADAQGNPVACSNIGPGVINVAGLAVSLASGAEHHGYMLALPFSKVWPAYKKYLDKLYPGRNTD